MTSPGEVRVPRHSNDIREGHLYEESQGLNLKGIMWLRHIIHLNTGMLMLTLPKKRYADAVAGLAIQSVAKQCTVSSGCTRHTCAAVMHVLHSIRTKVLGCATDIPASVEVLV